MHYLTGHLLGILSMCGSVTLLGGMSSSQLKDDIVAREAVRDLNAVTLARPASIRFLEMKGGSNLSPEEDPGSPAIHPENGLALPE